MIRILSFLHTRVSRHENEVGMTTAELLANAALAVAALVVIWAALSGVGSRVTNFIQSSLPG